MHINDLLMRCLLFGYNVPGKSFRVVTLDGSVVGLASGTVVAISGNVGVVPGGTTARIPVDNTLTGGLTTSAITVGLSAVALPSTAYLGRRHITIYNYSDNVVFLGNTNVTIANGLPLPSSTPYAIDLNDDVAIYAVASTPSDIRVLEAK